MNHNPTPPHPTCDNCALMNLRICRNYIARFCLLFNRYIPDYTPSCNYYATKPDRARSGTTTRT